MAFAAARMIAPKEKAARKTSQEIPILQRGPVSRFDSDSLPPSHYFVIEAKLSKNPVNLSIK